MCNDSGFIFLSFKSFPWLDCGLSLDGNSGGYIQNPRAPQQQPPSPSSKPPTLSPAAPNLPLLSVLSPHGQPDQAILGAPGAPISWDPTQSPAPSPAPWPLAPEPGCSCPVPSPVPLAPSPLSSPALCCTLHTLVPTQRLVCCQLTQVPRNRHRPGSGCWAGLGPGECGRVFESHQERGRQIAGPGHCERPRQGGWSSDPAGGHWAGSTSYNGCPRTHYATPRSF